MRRLVTLRLRRNIMRTRHKSQKRSSQMAKSPASPQQQGQQPGGTPQAGTPIFKDWASI
jgi:hypothetical protein